MKLIKDLEKYRLENRLSQHKLAVQLGVSVKSVNRWMNGRNKPNRIARYIIEKYLKSTPVVNSK